MYELRYFLKGKGFAASDFENTRKIEFINPKQISSISSIEKFTLPLSGRLVRDFSIVSMQNGDRFYIDPEEFSKIIEFCQSRDVL